MVAAILTYSIPFLLSMYKFHMTNPLALKLFVQEAKLC